MLSAGLGLGSAGLRSCKHAGVNAHVRLLQHDHTHLMLSLLTNSVVCELSHTAQDIFCVLGYLLRQIHAHAPQTWHKIAYDCHGKMKTTMLPARTGNKKNSTYEMSWFSRARNTAIVV